MKIWLHSEIASLKIKGLHHLSLQAIDPQLRETTKSFLRRFPDTEMDTLIRAQSHMAGTGGWRN